MPLISHHMNRGHLLFFIIKLEVETRNIQQLFLLGVDMLWVFDEVFIPDVLVSRQLSDSLAG